ncbi:MAG TPA: MlaD family protein [Solirubrobacteraceae bacterium]|jgi:phospholipid/cholesterol/gamma-HCH transport system substrate-binding protein
MRKRTAVQIRRYGRSFAVLLALMAVGTGCGFYILLQQRLPNPFQSFYAVDGAFPTAAAVVPGLGEPVTVAGVHVGEIVGTSLQDGRGVIHMEIDPSKLTRLYRDASAELVPNTPLKDMEVDIQPGHASAGALAHGATIPVGQTTSPIDSDELLASLDGDTREWFTSLVTELTAGTTGRGSDIKRLAQSLGPTTEQLRQIGDLLAGRRQELALIVHNLGRLTQATSVKDAQLETVVRAGNATVGALAGQNDALRRSIVALPPTLSTARHTLVDVAGLANALGPTATALLPTARRLPTTLGDARTLIQGAALLPLQKIPAFTRAVLPLAAQLPPLTSDLRQEIPPLTSTFKVLAYATNEIAYNQGSKNPGFGYWLPWFAHNADSFISNSDANGPVWRALLIGSCSSLASSSIGSVLETVLGTTFGC